MQRVSSEEFSCSLEFMGAGIKSGIVMLGWMCFPVLRLLILSCTYIVHACGKDLRLLAAQTSTEAYMLAQEVLENVLLVFHIIFVFELRRCVGIRMCNSNTPIKSSFSYFITRLARPHIGVLVCRRENPIIVEYVSVYVRT